MVKHSLTLRAGVIDPSDPFSYSPDAQFALILSNEEIAQFEFYCASNVNKTNTLVRHPRLLGACPSTPAPSAPIPLA
jgi:hypothetical protein